VSEHARQEDEAALCPRSFASGWAASQQPTMTLAGIGNDLGLLLASGGIHTANRQGVLVAVHPDEHGAPFTWACGTSRAARNHAWG
jgi:hypothetical protein